MKIKSIKVIEGKNKWSDSKDKLIHMVLDLGEYEQKPSNKIDGFYERIKEYLPSIKSHRCSEGKPGGFLKRIKEGTWMGHIIEHVALELQTLAGYNTGWGRTRGVKGQKGVYNVVFNYEDDDKGKLAAREAYNVVNDIINNKNPQIDKIIKKLKTKTLQESIRKVLREERSNRTQEKLKEMIKTLGVVLASKAVGGLDNLVKKLGLEMDDLKTQEMLAKSFIYHTDIEDVDILHLEINRDRPDKVRIKIHFNTNNPASNMESWLVRTLCDEMNRFFPFTIAASWEPAFAFRSVTVILDSEQLVNGDDEEID